MYCATWPDLEGIGGYYFNNCSGCSPSAYASNEEVGRKLWELSEGLVFRKVGGKGQVYGEA